LNGGGGADGMAGALGDDTYFVDNAGDRVLEYAGQGTDTVFTSVSYSLAANQEVEVLATTDNAATTAINLTGNEFGQKLQGNSGANALSGGGGNDVLDGGGGNDWMAGGTGNDIYTVDNAGDKVIEGANEGTDIVFS